MNGEISPSDSSDATRSALFMIYNDLGARLAHDNDNTSAIVAFSGVLLALLAGLIVSKPMPAAATIAASVACLSLASSMAFGFFALLLFRDVRRFVPFKRALLGRAGQTACECIGAMLGELGKQGRWSLFHTRDIVGRGIGHVAREQYLSDVDTYFVSDLRDYVFFLAYMIEVRKRPRLLSLTGVLIGGVGIAIAVLSTLWQHIP